MFIQELARRGPSGSEKVNFLWRHDSLPLYLSDNHLTALWCWRREFPDRAAPYTFIHVDTHWDAREMFPADVALLESRWGALHSFEDFRALDSVCMGSHNDRPKFVLFDNYIDPFLKLYRNLTGAHVTAHQERSEGLEGALMIAVAACEAQIYSLRSFFLHIDTLLSEAQSPVILNIDIDYFFVGIDGEEGSTLCAFDPSFIRSFFSILARHWDRIRVMTIALSPEYCALSPESPDGWAPAEKVCRIAFDALGVKYPLRRPRRSAAPHAPAPPARRG